MPRLSCNRPTTVCSLPIAFLNRRRLPSKRRQLPFRYSQMPSVTDEWLASAMWHLPHQAGVKTKSSKRQGVRACEKNLDCLFILNRTKLLEFFDFESKESF